MVPSSQQPQYKGTYTISIVINEDFATSSVSKESACNAGHSGLMPGLGSSQGEGKGYPSNILAWRIPWTEEPDRLQSTGLQESDTT